MFIFVFIIRSNYSLLIQPHQYLLKSFLKEFARKVKVDVSKIVFIDLLVSLGFFGTFAFVFENFTGYNLKENSIKLKQMP